MNIYYVYAYLREDGTPYYIGKGSGNRAWKKWGKKDIQPPQDTNRITIVENNLVEQAAFDLERRLIAQYGRKDLGTGILHNKTEGGEGSSGHKQGGWKWSEESRARRSGAGNPAYGKTTSDKQKTIASKTHTGLKHSEEWRANQSAGLKGRKILWAEKISQALKGKKQSPEIIAKRAESCRRTWAAKKAANK